MQNNKSLSDSNLKEYFKRCFFSVDGFWFIVVEKEFGFSKALEIDQNVWKLLPKSQVRKIRQLLEIRTNGINDLHTALQFKLEAEDYGYEVLNISDQVLEVTITKCPWLTVMRESGRQELAAQVGKTICPTEYSVWAKEFGMKLDIDLSNCLCLDNKPCVLRFGLAD